MSKSQESTVNSLFSDNRSIDVVVIDDEESMGEGCRQTLEADGLSAMVARDGKGGLELVKKSQPAIVVLDLKMPGMSGVEVLSKISGIDSTIVPIVMTGYGTVSTAVESMKTGAFDFISKPFEPERLIEAVRRGMKLNKSRKEALEKQKKIVVKTTHPLDKQNIVLNGLEALGNYYSLGLENRNFFEEVKYLEAEAKYHAERLGQVKEKEKTIRGIVKDLRLVDEIVSSYNYKKGALLQILLDVQSQLNWLPRYAIKWLAVRLNISLSSIYSIANFYEAFNLEPVGKHTIQICMGTACHVKGSPDLLTKVSAVLGIQPGQTDKDQLFSLKTVNCMGCCALAPVLKIDEKYYSNPKMDELKEIFSTYKDQEVIPCKN